MVALLAKVSLLIALLISFPVAVFSQSLRNVQPSDTSVPIILVKGMPTIGELKNHILKQTGLGIIHDESLNEKMIVDLPTGIYTLGFVLNFLSVKMNLHYTMDSTLITLKNSTDEKLGKPNFGEVTDTNKRLLPDVRITSNGKIIGYSDKEGKFTYWNDTLSSILEFSLEGYTPQSVKKTYGKFLTVVLEIPVKELQTVVVKGYQDVTQENKTSTVVVIEGKNISGSPAGSVTDIMQGRLTGILVTDYNGSPAGFSNIQIRGRQSIGPQPGKAPSNHPLILLNGTALITSNRSLSTLLSMAGEPGGTGYNGGISVLAGLHPLDIDRVEFFKDADATAMFGSRGAHGVISIWTKSGRMDRTSFSINASRSMAMSTFIPSMMNSEEFAALLYDLYYVPGQSTIPTSPWTTRWPISRYTNWPKFYLGGTARQQQVHFSVSGKAGNYFSYYSSMSFHEETNISPFKRSNQKTSFALSVSHHAGPRLKSDLSVVANHSHYQLPPFNSSSLSYLLPNAPDIKDSIGNLVFDYDSLPFYNPAAQSRNIYFSKLFMLHTTLSSEYAFSSKIFFKMRVGLNSIQSSEQSKYPIAAFHPRLKMTGMLETSNGRYWGYSVEPRFQYVDTTNAARSTFSFSIGTTYLMQTEQIKNIHRSGFTTDYLMNFPETAPYSVKDTVQDLYKYAGLFSGLNFTFQKRYILNLTGRLDASSRFGPNKQAALFGAIGVAWIFTKESWVKRHLSFLSFGKLLVNIGTAGNDNTGNHNEINEVVTDRLSYNGVRSIRPALLANPDLGWEQNFKKEIALEGTIGKTLSFMLVWYHNVTSRQYVTANLPSQAGGAVMGVNHAARVLNTGFELWISTNRKWQSNKNSWKPELTFTIPRNRLLSFQNLESSPYSRFLEVGQSLSVRKGLKFTGVDPATGLNTFLNVSGSSDFNAAENYGVLGDLDPVAYGGFCNTLTLRQWEFSLLIEGRIQKAIDPIIQDLAKLAIGYDENKPFNLPSYFVDRWRKPGDIAANPQLSARPSTAQKTSLYNLMSSDRMLIDGSYLRIRYFSVGWTMPPERFLRDRLSTCRFYVKIQNLVTLTKFEGGDPTILSPIDLPSLRTVEAGLQLTF